MASGKLDPRLVPALFVKNMAETLAFYGKLGFDLTGCHLDQHSATWAENPDRSGSSPDEELCGR